MPEPANDTELAAAQAREYGTYVATERINIRGARAFNPGDPVPASHVTDGIVPDSSVAKVNTKAAQAVVAQTNGSES